MENGRCECEGLEGVELALCLAPPEGEYEAHIPVGPSLLVVNRRGAFFRVTGHEEGLPMLTTFDRPVSLEDLVSSGRLDLGLLLCRVAEGLREAALHGSVVAAEKFNRCRGVVQRVLSGCGGPGPE